MNKPWSMFLFVMKSTEKENRLNILIKKPNPSNNLYIEGFDDLSMNNLLILLVPNY
jgi:hypothetical protein